MQIKKGDFVQFWLDPEEKTCLAGNQVAEVLEGGLFFLPVGSKKPVPVSAVPSQEEIQKWRTS